MSGNVSFHKLVLLDEILHTGQVATIIIMGQGSFNLKKDRATEPVNIN